MGQLWRMPDMTSPGGMRQKNGDRQVSVAVYKENGGFHADWTAGPGDFDWEGNLEDEVAQPDREMPGLMQTHRTCLHTAT